MELRAIEESMRQTADNSSVILPENVAVASAQTADGGEAVPEPEGGIGGDATEKLRKVQVAAKVAGEFFSKGTHRFPQHGVESEPVKPFGAVSLGAGLLSFETNSLPNLAGKCEAPAIEDNLDLPLTLSELSLARPVTGQADAAYDLDWHGIRFRPEVFDSVKVVKYSVHGSTRDEVIAIAAFLDAWKKT